MRWLLRCALYAGAILIGAVVGVVVLCVVAFCWWVILTS